MFYLNARICLTDLLEVAPGLPRGVAFEKRSPQRLTSAPLAVGGVINLSDILSAQDDILFGDEEEDEVVASPTATVSDYVMVEQSLDSQANDFGVSFDEVVKVCVHPR